MSVAYNTPLDPALLSAEQFDAMDLPDSCKWELVEGVVGSVTFPDLDHVDIQDRIRTLLRTVLKDRAVVRIEYPYATDAYNKNRADVAVVDPLRHAANRQHLDGAPEIVVEVVSRSNRESRIAALGARCFAHGCLQFWRVYPAEGRVVISTAGAGQREYISGGSFSLTLFEADVNVAVAELFSA